MPSHSALVQKAAAVASCLSDHAAAIDVEGDFPTEEFRWLHAAKLLGAPVPTEFGGAGLGTSRDSTPDLLKVLWHIGYGNLAVGRLYEGHVNALQLIHWFGDTDQKQRWFDDALAGENFRRLEYPGE